jgi:hypothetical protein
MSSVNIYIFCMGLMEFYGGTVSFRIVNPCRIGVVDIGMRKVCTKMLAKLVNISGKVCIFIDLLLMYSSVRALIVKMIR